VTNHPRPAKRYQVFSTHDGMPHKCIAEYNTLEELRGHQLRTDVVELVQIKPRMYVPLREYLAIRKEERDA
jgi:hypothetical protein